MIRQVLKAGARYSGRFLEVRSLHCDDQLRQFCIRTPKSVGKAVRRNRAKRVIREQLRKRMQLFRPGTRAVITLRRLPASDLSFHLADDLMRFLDDA